jgi:hypothetical protein
MNGSQEGATSCYGDGSQYQSVDCRRTGQLIPKKHSGGLGFGGSRRDPHIVPLGQARTGP